MGIVFFWKLDMELFSDDYFNFVIPMLAAVCLLQDNNIYSYFIVKTY